MTPIKLTLQGGLPFVPATIVHRGQQIRVENVLVDTGSGGTVFAADDLAEVGILPEPADELHRLSGIGGTEYVFSKTIDSLSVGRLSVDKFCIEVGALDYGFAIQGILGVDYLRAVGAVIDLEQLTLHAN